LSFFLMGTGEGQKTIPCLRRGEKWEGSITQGFKSRKEDEKCRRKTLGLKRGEEKKSTCRKKGATGYDEKWRQNKKKPREHGNPLFFRRVMRSEAPKALRQTMATVSNANN